MSNILTKVEIQKKNKDRVNVYIDDNYEFACSIELVYKYNLVKGRKVDCEYLKEITLEDNYIKCKNRALKFIERGYKTEKETRDKLMNSGFEESTIDRVIVFLKQYKFVDDNKYVKLYITDKIKNRGKIKIKFGLLKKGIAEELIDQELSTVDSIDESNTAYEIAQKKFNIIIKSENNKNKIIKKLSDYLLRKGYNYELINSVVKNVLDENNDKIKEIESKTEIIKSNNKLKENKSFSMNNCEQLYDIAVKRYNIIRKSESNNIKIYKKLYDYLMRRGYNSDEIKKTLKEVVDFEDDKAH